MPASSSRNRCPGSAAAKHTHQYLTGTSSSATVTIGVRRPEHGGRRGGRELEREPDQRAEVVAERDGGARKRELGRCEPTLSTDVISEPTRPGRRARGAAVTGEGKGLARPEGFEPPTPASGGQCSIH